MTKKTKIEVKDIAVRALKTFFQAFLASLVLMDDPWTEKAIMGAVAAGISVVWNSRKLLLGDVFGR